MANDEETGKLHGKVLDSKTALCEGDRFMSDCAIILYRRNWNHSRKLQEETFKEHIPKVFIIVPKEDEKNIASCFHITMF